MRSTLILAATAPLLLSNGAPARLEIGIDNLRNTNGIVRLCIAPSASAYPACPENSGAKRINVPAAQARSVVIDGVGLGVWAIAVMHDENGNGRLDTTLGAPREGFGFSNNPPVGFGAPAFTRVRFEVAGPVSRQRVRMRYLL